MIIEAWSARTPVVAIAAKGPAELISDGIDGRLSPLEDPVALAGTIDELLDDPDDMRALGLAGRCRFEQHFSMETAVRTWGAFLQTVSLTGVP